MKVIVAGGRDFNNYKALDEILSLYIFTDIDTIICGDARGADMLGAQWAAAHGVPIQHYPAYWEQYGKSAGFIRNAEMGEHADYLLAFWDGKSPGTKHMIKTMKRLKKPYEVFDYNGERIETG